MAEYTGDPKLDYAQQSLLRAARYTHKEFWGATHDWIQREDLIIRSEMLTELQKGNNLLRNILDALQPDTETDTAAPEVVPPTSPAPAG